MSLNDVKNNGLTFGFATLTAEPVHTGPGTEPLMRNEIPLLIASFTPSFQRTDLETTRIASPGRTGREL